MRLKVKIDVSKPLRRIIKFIDKDGIERMGLLKYERLPDFCHSCGTIGYTLKDKGMRRNGVKVNGKPERK
ncbi:hypothetical protein Golax_020534 [Gossypium laxum]|uniref:Zinc knuckle CX2CX4HX4C domain-containing protein n=1 Tax=Gossypium laxum TaxID=34288 RepID=A0A7J9AYC2_9ROSI|nr:hypothetical protein [Gossypium laxum]